MGRCREGAALSELFAEAGSEGNRLNMKFGKFLFDIGKIFIVRVIKYWNISGHERSGTSILEDI